MDWDNFVQRARGLGARYMLKPDQFLIGVLDHRKAMQDELEIADFYWMTGNEKSIGKQVRTKYQNHLGVQGIRLYFKNALVSDSDLLKTFTKSEDDFIVFAAIDHVQAGTQSPTSALPSIKQFNAQASQTSGEANGTTASTVLLNYAGDTLPDVKHNHIKEEKLPSPVPASLPSNNPTANVATTLEPDSTFGVSREETSRKTSPPLDREIRRIIELQDPDLLEAGVAQARQILKSFKHALSHRDSYSLSSTLASWKKAVETLIPQAKRNRTIIGVVGNTGAGKSSVINAILDEERLVPTNCMRACTAVVTEISWNSDAITSKYRAEIEFISREDWGKELSVLMQEFLSGNGTLSSEVYNPNSDAGIAWAKFRAVYPSVAKDKLCESIIPTLMSETSVDSVLGTTKHICMNQSETFYTELQRYVDSKEKVARKGKNKAEAQKPPSEMEYWPLIKVVKIYTTSPVLSTGAVIVDLPGVHDNNAARAAVAQGYMKQCTGLWIVAPITRAVDDKAAKTLLGDSFRRQLKYDGGLSSVTFVCSKTDDISIMEAIGSLGLEEQSAELNSQQDVFDEKLQEVERKVRDLEKSQSIYRLKMEDVSDDIERYLTLQVRLQKGEVVSAPVTRPSKRKKVDLNKQPRKRRHMDDDSGCDSEDSSSQAEDELPDSEDEVPKGKPTQLFEPDVKQKLQELKDTKANARDLYQDTKKKIKELRSKVRELKAQKSRIKAQIRHICIAGRNHYSKFAIQQDFAAGIKELDQENAADLDEDGFDPENDIRDYQQVAESLPVFCISSRAYQKICGRMRTDDSVSGFVTANETEVPQLQDHCRKLTEAGRVQTSRTFLGSFCQLLITARLWTLDTKPNLEMTEKDKAQLDFVKFKLKELNLAFEKIRGDCIKDLRSHIKRGIFNKCPELINDAINAAPEKAQAWGQKDQGGLRWISYRAVIRRDGVFHSLAAGHRDFNSDLVCPITTPLASPWEKVFQRELPKVIAKHVGNLGKLPRTFHEAVKKHAKCSNIHPTTLSLLGSQLPNYEQMFKDIQHSLVTKMKKLQREANRSFAPCVGEVMNAGYQACAAEHGPGSYKRMREIMASHVEAERHTMFHKAIQNVEKHLDKICDQLQVTMTCKMAEISDQIDANYMSTFGDHLMQSQTKEDAKLKSILGCILDKVDAKFAPIANGDISSVNGTAHLGNRDKARTHADKGKHHSIHGPARKSFKKADHEKDNFKSSKPGELRDRVHGLGPLPSVP